MSGEERLEAEGAADEASEVASVHQVPAHEISRLLGMQKPQDLSERAPEDSPEEEIEVSVEVTLPLEENKAQRWDWFHSSLNADHPHDEGNPSPFLQYVSFSF